MFFCDVLWSFAKQKYRNVHCVSTVLAYVMKFLKLVDVDMVLMIRCKDKPTLRPLSWQWIVCHSCVYFHIPKDTSS